MEKFKNLKPLYIYLIGSALACIGSFFDKTPVISYSFLILAFFFIIFGIVKYLRE
ncbi:hypothetical protein [Flavobacterium wongokense]|uniref:hypothetical protein n=1 Tax=Flavobacterium wongokense TaxID=2910674 RepID=UPI001F34FBA1|nr:hypothetical protein [Flavobacterium sp. WG47]MCF6131179.1 hypothetical protein [Flavobacterium sp. WG47]